jgi:hypothetical protein
VLSEERKWFPIALVIKIAQEEAKCVSVHEMHSALMQFCFIIRRRMAGLSEKRYTKYSHLSGTTKKIHENFQSV